MPDVTQILDAIDAGDPRAAAQLLPLVYDELRRLAASKLAHENAGHTLEPTALVHEAYLKLVGPANGAADAARFANRSHFFAAAAEAMRRILIDSARKKRSEKRGGGRHRVAADDLESPARCTDDLLAIDDALGLLEAEDAESARLVKLRFYAGLSVDEAADAMGLPRATAYRTWAYAKAWLRMKLQ